MSSHLRDVENSNQCDQEIRIQHDLRVPMRDGVALSCDLWLPVKDGPSSTILYRTPYDRRLLNSEFLRPIDAVRSGFSVIVQDTRGRFGSEGKWQPIMWEQEGEDGFDTVAWIAQQPWSNGSVGMSGPSYLGIAQLMAARLKPPALKAIAPAITTIDAFERTEMDGGMRLDHLISWIAFMALDWAEKRTAAGDPLDASDFAAIVQAVQNPRSLMDHRPLKEIPLFKIEGFPVTFESLLSGEASADVDVAEIDIPTLHVGGWFDVFARSTVGMFGKQRAAGNRNAHMLMGCWTHSTTLGQQHGEVNFGLQASANGGRIADQHIAFFKQHLDGEDGGLPAARYFRCIDGDWADASSWPPENAETVVCTLACQKSDTLSYYYDPNDPTPTIGGRVLFIGGLAMGPIDQRKLDGRSDFLRFETPPLDENLELAGPANAKLVVASSALSTDFICKLIDIGEDGTRLPITDGMRRIDFTETANSLGQKEITIKLCDIAWRISKGHRIGLQIQSANYPHLDPNFNDGKTIGESLSGPIASNTVFISSAQSTLELSVIGSAPNDGLTLNHVAD